MAEHLPASRSTLPVAVSGLGLLGLLALQLGRPPARRPAARALTLPPRRSTRLRGFAVAPPALNPHAALEGARRLNRAAGMLAASVLADSAVEHYRGAFHNKAMVTPLVTASLSLAVSIHGNRDHRPVPHAVRDTVYAIAGVTGVVGTLFHIYNIGKRPGGFRWENFFYAAPVGAPMALSLSGMMGFLAERVRDTTPGISPRILDLPAGRVVGAATGLGLLGTVAEAGLLHFRGAYQNPFMFLPVTIPPVTAALIGKAAASAPDRNLRWTRWWLRITAMLGFAGAGFHIFGVSRMMGGWRNWSQNVLNGPPIPAPPSFTGLAIAGLAALGLMEDHPDD